LSEFDSLDEGIRKLGPKDVGRLYFEHVVTERNQICDLILLHILASLQESFNFPLLVVLWVHNFVFSASRYDFNVTFQLFENSWQKSVR